EAKTMPSLKASTSRAAGGVMRITHSGRSAWGPADAHALGGLAPPAGRHASEDLDPFRTVPYSYCGGLKPMSDPVQRKGAEAARNELPDLLAAAEKGRPTIITRHGRPVAALVPIDSYGAALRQPPLLPLKGSGRGLWGRSSAITIRKLRDEWSR